LASKWLEKATGEAATVAISDDGNTYTTIEI
jgi:hypothetical protein